MLQYHRISPSVSISVVASMMLLQACQSTSGSEVSTATPWEPRPIAASADWCVDYNEVVEGIWTNDLGSDTLYFRLGVTQNEGCYAALHPVPEWDIELRQIRPWIGQGSIAGAAWTWAADGHRVTVDRDAMTAEFIEPSGDVTTGYLLPPS